jgi:hypothetical protein
MMMSQGEQRFHKDVFLPKIKLPMTPGTLTYTKHAREAAADDKYGNLTALLPKQIVLGECELVEVRLEGKKVTQVLVRFEVAPGLDLVMAVGTGYVVYTVWGQQQSDQHKTLNRKLYATKVA